MNTVLGCLSLLALAGAGQASDPAWVSVEKWNSRFWIVTAESLRLVLRNSDAVGSPDGYAIDLMTQNPRRRFLRVRIQTQHRGSPAQDPFLSGVAQRLFEARIHGRVFVFHPLLSRKWGDLLYDPQTGELTPGYLFSPHPEVEGRRWLELASVKQRLGEIYDFWRSVQSNVPM